MDYLSKKESFNKVYLIISIVLIIISFPMFSLTSKFGDAVVNKIKSDNLEYQNLSTNTILEGELKAELIKRNELLLSCNQHTSRLSGLFIAVFPFLSGIFFLLIWFLNLKTINTLKKQ